MDHPKQAITAIIKTTFACNMACLYCYEGKQPKDAWIDLGTVRNALTKLVDYLSPQPRPICVIWHGGEPLLMGLDFYKETIAIQQSFGPDCRFRNIIQTNGILLSTEFAEFFLEHGFSIGLSLDGPPIIHDSQRPLLSGDGSFDRAFAALERIQSLSGKNHALRPAALAVFTRNTLDHLDEFYDFFARGRINVQLSPLLYAGNANDSKARSLQLDPVEYGQALVYLFDRWLSEDQYEFTFDPFEWILASLVLKDPVVCTFAGRCYDRYLSIDPDGSIIPCGRWHRDEFLYGNINSDTIEQALRSPDHERFKQGRAKIADSCGDCPHFDICHGGCAFSGYMRRHHLADRDSYCVGYRLFFDHLTSVVREQLTSARNEQAKGDRAPC